MSVKNQKGQTIVEAIVALAAVFVIVAAIAVAILNAVNNSQFVKNQNLANKYAQQGMEFVRSIHADNIEEFQQLSGDYALGDDDQELVPGEDLTVNVGNTHVRNINFVDDEEPCSDTGNEGESISLKKVTVTVSWSSGRCQEDDRFCHDTTLVSCIPYERNPNIFP